MMGDAASDRLLSFEVTVNSVTLTSGAGTVSVLASPTRLELTHLSGTLEPLVLRGVPQGTYSQATITFASPEATLLDATGKPIEVTPTLNPATVTVTFNPALTVGQGAMVLSLDVDLASSITIDANNNVTFSPVVHASTKSVAAEDNQHPEDGALEDVNGTVSSVGSSSFTINTPSSSQPLTFTVNSTTEFKDGLAGLSSLTAGMIVEVEGVTAADGSLLAKEVEAEVEVENGLEDDGIVISTTGTPVTQFQIVLQGFTSGAAITPTVGNTVTVNVDSNTSFKVADSVDLTNLPFTPVFDASHLIKGQSVEVDADTAVMDNVSAKRVKLHELALTGTVSNFSGTSTQASFTLTVPGDSAFAMLTGTTTVTVFQQPSTELQGITSIANNDQLRARGLLFLDGANLRLVAQRITAP